MFQPIIVLSTILLVATINTEFRSFASANLLDNTQQKYEQQNYAPKDRQMLSKLEYQLDKSNDEQENRGHALLSYISSLIFRNKLITSVLSYFDRSKSTDPKPLYDVSFRFPNNDDPHIQIPRGSEAAKFEASLSHDAPPQTVSSAGRHITDEAWANTLFGPTGVLTTIFRLMDDRRRDSIPSRTMEQINTETEQKPTNPGTGQKLNNDSKFQSDFLSFPDFFNKAKPVDLAKIFNAFLNGPQGDFEDPVAELPEFLGICNRLSCGDIYKAIDQFRKSDFFTNFQTALQLIQDPKGWEILGDLLSNPELIAQFTKGSGFEHFLGSTLPTSKIPTKKPNKEVDTTDRNLGIDFSEMVNEVKFEKPVKPTAAELPEIAESVDRNIDYYSAIENGEDSDDLKGGSETYIKPEETVSISEASKKSGTDNEDISLPEISESIDENIESITETSILPSKNLSTSRNSSVVQRPDQVTLSKTTTVRPSSKSQMVITRANRIGKANSARKTTLTPPTTSNFRRDNDYYAMYYDD